MQATYLIKFFVLMRGALTPPPSIEAPVMKMPLRDELDEERSTHVTNGRVPSCAQHTKAYAETNTGRCPRIRTCLLEKLANIECLSGACRLCGNSVGVCEQKWGARQTSEEQIERNDNREKRGQPKAVV